MSILGWIFLIFAIVVCLAALVFFTGPSVIEAVVNFIDYTMEKANEWAEIIRSLKE